MTVHVAQISDTHLSEAKPFFNTNFARLGEALHEAAVDLVINSGDISLDGAELDADLRRAHGLHEALDLDWLATSATARASARPTRSTRTAARAIARSSARITGRTTCRVGG
jgi:3',5'-cyclic AMP phosphodiesterase CpdA